MEPIEVTAKFDAQGRITPLRFSWGERRYRVDSTGRRWSDEQGYHLLVMVAPGRVFHLLFGRDGVWYLIPRPSIPTAG